MKISNRTYDTIKWIALVFVPALNFLVLTLGDIWHFPYYVQIAATIAAFGVFLAAIIKKSADSYNKEAGGEVTKDADGNVEYLADDDDYDIEEGEDYEDDDIQTD